MFQVQLKKYRENMNLSQQELADKLGVRQSTVGMWESGANKPRHSTLIKIAKLLQVSVDELTGETDAFSKTLSSYLPENIIPIKTYSVPLVGTIACGTPTLAEENIEEYVKVSEEIQCDFALRCRGDSMINARIFDGDIVYIRQMTSVENGEIAAVLIDKEATLKKVYIYPNRIELRAENPTFKTLEFEGESMNEVKILGKAVAFFSLVR